MSSSALSAEASVDLVSVPCPSSSSSPVCSFTSCSSSPHPPPVHASPPPIIRTSVTREGKKRTVQLDGASDSEATEEQLQPNSSFPTGSSESQGGAGGGGPAPPDSIFPTATPSCLSSSKSTSPSSSSKRRPKLTRATTQFICNLVKETVRKSHGRVSDQEVHSDVAQSCAEYLKLPIVASDVKGVVRQARQRKKRTDAIRAREAEELEEFEAARLEKLARAEEAKTRSERAKLVAELEEMEAPPTRTFSDICNAQRDAVSAVDGLAESRRQQRLAEVEAWKRERAATTTSSAESEKENQPPAELDEERTERRAALQRFTRYMDESSEQGKAMVEQVTRIADAKCARRCQ